MRRPIKVLLLLHLIFAGCTPKAIPGVVYQDQKNIVRLEARHQDPHQTPKWDFQHPLTLTEEELAILLQSVRIQKPKTLFSIFKRTSSHPSPAFSEEEARRMAGPLSTTLARARPNERVAFFFTFPRGRFFEGITSGILFVKADRLHLIMGRYRAASRPHEKDITLTDPALPNPPYYGFRLSPGPYQALVALEESPLWREPIGSGHWVMINYREALAHPEGHEPFPVASEPSGANDQPETDQPLSADIKERLSLLKELRDENLISEEEYNEKRQELLKEF